MTPLPLDQARLIVYIPFLSFAASDRLEQAMHGYNSLWTIHNLSIFSHCGECRAGARVELRNPVHLLSNLERLCLVQFTCNFNTKTFHKLIQKINKYILPSILVYITNSFFYIFYFFLVLHFSGNVFKSCFNSAI